jgi:hypothetical protein
MGALAFKENPPDLSAALGRFSGSSTLSIKSLGIHPNTQITTELGGWLKRWRAYGRTGHNQAEQMFPGFQTAKADHDHGVARLQRQQGNGPTFRAALGLPIVQFFGGARQTVNWEWQWNAQKNKGEGRFASPVLLRPHRDAQGNWHALVIFVDAHKWPDRKPVFLNGQPRDVSLGLYEAMKSDPRLRPFL